jgi:predicted ATPase/Tfp pilus assembly protein PilF
VRDLVSRFERFIGELKHRRVFRAGLTYAVAAWLTIEVAATVFPLLYIPDSAATLVVILAVLGAPVALALAWAYDIERGGVRRAGNAEGPAGDESSESAEEVAAAGTGPGGGDAVRAPNGIPPSVTPLVGRVEERRELERLLGDPDTRLVTVAGPGGMGKTRLTLEVARAAAPFFAHGACFVPLAGMDPASPLVPTIAERLGLTLGGREDPGARVAAYLLEKSLLLVIDNFEPFTEQAEVLSRVLTQAPGVKILVSSRERLNLRGETLFPLEGLAFPAEGEEEIEGYDAVRLFLQTGRRVDPRRALPPEEHLAVGRICRYVQGVPLAIELAAAWVGMLSCEEIWREIERSRDFLTGSARDLPERHRSLRAVFQTSWQLLTEPEREAVRRLSVFRGGFGREAAAAVAGASLPVLTGLVEKSILQRQPSGRFEALEILREYAGERLAADPAEARETARRHADHYADFLYSRRASLERMADRRAADEVGAEIENVREAWRWMVRESRPAEMTRALDGLHSFYEARGWAREGEAAFGEAAARLRATSPAGEPGGQQDLRHRLLARQGAFLMQLGEIEKARRLLGSALRHFEGTGEWAETALALGHLGRIATSEGDYERAGERFRESLAIYREHGSGEGTARSCIHLGMLAFMRGDYAEARRLFQEGLDLFRRAGDRRRVATALKNLGGVAFEEEAYDEANALLLESVEIDREMDSPQAVANSLQNLGCVAVRAGDHARAESYLHQGSAISRRMGFRAILAACLSELGNLYQAQGRADDATEHYRQALAIAAEIQQMPSVLEILLGFARLAHDRGEDGRAATLLSVVLAHPASARHTRKEAERLAGVLAHPLPSPEGESAVEAVERTVADLLGPSHLAAGSTMATRA